MPISFSIVSRTAPLIASSGGVNNVNRFKKFSMLNMKEKNIKHHEIAPQPYVLYTLWLVFSPKAQNYHPRSFGAP